MAENQIDIVLRGKNETATAIAQVKNDLAGMFASTQGDIDKLRGIVPPLDAAKASAAGVGGEMTGLDAIIPGIGSKLATAFSVAGVVMFAKEVAGAVWGLNQMREESAQIEARFIAFGGGAAKATEALHAMDAAIGGAMTRDEKMAAVARITSLELTKSAQGTAELARQALLLGAASASAESKIDSLTQILVTGRTMGLAQYGISTQAVNERVKELQAETSTLSDIEAKQIAIKEALAVKADALAAAGGRAATATREMANATDDLKDAIADMVNLDGAVVTITDHLRMAALLLRQDQPDAQLALANQYLASLEERKQRLSAGGPLSIFDRVNLGSMGEIDAEIDKVTAKLQYLKMAAAEWSDGGQRGAALMAANIGKVTPEVTAVGTALESLRKAKDATDVNTVAMALFKGEITQAQVAALGLAGALALVTGSGAVGNQGAYWGGVTGSTAPVTAESLAAYGKSADAVLAEVIRRAGETGNAIVKAGLDAGKANETAAKATQAAWEKAFDAVADSAKSEFGKAQGQLKGLLPDMNLGGENAPGSNGPFEGVFRAADVAAHGAASPWAAKLGLDQASAKKIVSDFAQGFRTPEVMKLIDEALLIDQVRSAQAAADSLTAWGNAIAEKAGVSSALQAGNKAVTNAIFGGTTKAAGKDSAGVQTTSYDAAAQAMLDGFAASAQTQVGDATFGKDMGKIGTQTFALFETGVVDAAKESQGLKAAIFAMVAAAAAAQRAGAAAGVNDR